MGVAKALIAKPTLILADEPTGNLHTGQGREIMELFTEAQSRSTTIIQVTHSEANAASGSHRAAAGWMAGERLMPAESSRPQAPAADILQRARVLVADDQPDVLQALRLLLKGEGCDIETATSPAGVLSAVERAISTSR